MMPSMSRTAPLRLAATLLASLPLAACGGDAEPSGPPDVYFDLDAPADTFATFWDQPFPSDLRLTAAGDLDLAGYPNQRDTPLVNDLLLVASQHRAGPLMPVTYVRFGVEVPAYRWTDVVPAGVDQPVFLVNVDADSPEYGALAPLVVETLYADDFAPEQLVAVAPRPGFPLAPDTTYAVVYRRAFAPGAAVPDDFAALRDGAYEGTGRGAGAAAAYAPLWPALEALGVPADDVLLATVLTTGDETRRMYERSEAVRAAHDVTIEGLAIDPDDGDAHDGFCELVGTVTMPQFQVGTPSFSSDGYFEYEADGVTPVTQATMTIPLRITIPAREMPASGWPLFQFFHGSGGESSGVVDLGPIVEQGGSPTVGEGPGYVLARRGIAAASSAMPLNPERYPGAADTEYLNIDNLAAFPFTFQQGVYEQRLLLDALLALEISPATLAGCAGVALPAGATAHRFDPATLTAGGQSMGGMYTNLVGSVEPRFGALVPTGAGGFWSLMILETVLIPGAKDFISAAFATDTSRINFMHPGLNLLNLGWEITEPGMAMSRLARRPLDAPGFAPRHVYEPVGFDDVYFPTSVFDASALAYGNQQAGDEVWPEMQQALALDGLDGLAGYPVSLNVDRGDAGATTSVVVQFVPDEFADGHYIYRQLAGVKHQYGCFLATYIATGTPTVPAPGALDGPCD